MTRGKHYKESQILSGWKEIADYLRKGVRTVQRYEHALSLPIHRPAGKPSGTVTAIKTELDRWVKHDPVQMDERTARLHAQANRIGAQFLLVDVEVALTLSGMALNPRSGENRQRQYDSARKAYGTIKRLRRNFDLDEGEREKLNLKLQRLKSDLQKLEKIF